MSSKSIPRQADVEVSFGGIDITKSIKPYFRSLTYVDVESDETDDLQLDLQDRDGDWLQSWLEQMLDAQTDNDTTAETETATTSAAVTTGASGDIAVGDIVYFSGTTHYRSSNATSGYTCRPGPARVHMIYNGAHPYSLIHTDNTSNVYGWVDAEFVSKDAPEESEAVEETGEVAQGFTITAAIARRNWNGDGKDLVLDCGSFELDSITANGPGSTVSIKATSLPFKTAVRQTKKTKAWESYYLSAIAKEIADKNGMSCMYLSSSDPFYDRTEQFKTSDISFLSSLCKAAGISLKATGGIIVLFDQAEYEQKDPALTITFKDGSYDTYKLQTGTADKQFSSCRVSYVPPNGNCIEGIAYVEDYKEDSKTNQQLEINAKVGSIGEAKKLAEKYLRLHNKFEKTATFSVPGNPALVAGITCTLKKFGLWSGKYIISEARHTVSNNGYVTQINCRKVLEGY